MLTHEDLNRLADRLEARIDKRADGLDERLDLLNGRTRKNENDIAVLKDRSDEGKRAGAKWGAGAGAAIGGAIVTVYKLVSGQ